MQGRCPIKNPAIKGKYDFDKNQHHGFPKENVILLRFVLWALFQGAFSSEITFYKFFFHFGVLKQIHL